MLATNVAGHTLSIQESTTSKINRRKDKPGTYRSEEFRNDVPQTSNRDQSTPSYQLQRLHCLNLSPPLSAVHCRHQRTQFPPHGPTNSSSSTSGTTGPTTETSTSYCTN
ncbi:hypothetical protein ACFX14_034142 [Malus domestica]